jgi:predicted nucleic acid-binding Zn ribbon protein
MFTYISIGLCVLWLVSAIGVGVNMYKLFKAEDCIDILRYESNCNFYQTIMWMTVLANWMIWIIKTKG